MTTYTMTMYDRDTGHACRQLVHHNLGWLKRVATRWTSQQPGRWRVVTHNSHMIEVVW